ncbi:proline-rich protein 36-like [Cyprinodon tularosa]|uniref:proline-rich protein 36-like n=1 Tax=Cyprinodon tularosa TaxID=77115 RepID=UPI0018E1F88E|nr:proline-rich protein 36-like [Cyprinodon tularosa]
MAGYIAVAEWNIQDAFAQLHNKPLPPKPPLRDLTQLPPTSESEPPSAAAAGSPLPSAFSRRRNRHRGKKAIPSPAVQPDASTPFPVGQPDPSTLSVLQPAAGLSPHPLQVSHSRPSKHLLDQQIVPSVRKLKLAPLIKTPAARALRQSDPILEPDSFPVSLASESASVPSSPVPAPVSYPVSLASGPGSDFVPLATEPVSIPFPLASQSVSHPLSPVSVNTTYSLVPEPGSVYVPLASEPITIHVSPIFEHINISDSLASEPGSSSESPVSLSASFAIEPQTVRAPHIQESDLWKFFYGDRDDLFPFIPPRISLPQPESVSKPVSLSSESISKPVSPTPKPVSNPASLEPESTCTPDSLLPESVCEPASPASKTPRQTPDPALHTFRKASEIGVSEDTPQRVPQTAKSPLRALQATSETEPVPPWAVSSMLDVEPQSSAAPPAPVPEPQSATPPAPVPEPQSATPPAPVPEPQSATPPAPVPEPQSATPPAPVPEPQSATPPAPVHEPQSATPPAPVHEPQSATPPAPVPESQSTTPPAPVPKSQSATPPAPVPEPQSAVPSETVAELLKRRRRPPPRFDPFQFANRWNRSTKDVISSSPHLSLAHLEEKNTHVSMLFPQLDMKRPFNIWSLI